jgi:hypothetical protein
VRIVIEFGNTVIPRGQTEPVQMVFIESSEPNASRTANGLLRAYLYATRQFLESHESEHPMCPGCRAFEMHSRVVAAAGPIAESYNGK